LEKTTENELDLLGELRRTHYCTDVKESEFNTQVVLAGWIHEMRNLGGICFLQLRDRSGIAQVTLEKSHDENIFNTLTSLSRESVIMVKGLAKENDRAPGGFEVIPDLAKVLSKAEVPLPLGVSDMVLADLDTRLDNRFLDLRKEDINAVFRIKHKVLKAVSDTLSDRGFIEVNTPKIVATATEGGTELFRVKYFNEDAFLNQSPQLYKQTLMGAGFDRVFEIGPAFRAEEHDTVRHLNEFISLDIEMSFSDENDAMDALEEVTRNVVNSVAGCRDEIQLINQGRKKLNKLVNKMNMNINRQNKAIKKENQKLKSQSKPLKELAKPHGLYPMMEVEPIEGRVPRIRYQKCIDIAKKGGVKVEFGEDLSMEAMKVVAKKYPGYFFITHWPTAIKPFYVQPYEDEPEVCRAFDLNRGWYELASGAQRVHDIELLRKNLERMGLDPEAFSYYLNAFRYGMPPHAGWGCGLERYMIALTSVKNVREVVLFPRDRYRLVP